MEHLMGWDLVGETELPEKQKRSRWHLIRVSWRDKAECVFSSEFVTRIRLNIILCSGSRRCSCLVMLGGQELSPQGCRCQGVLCCQLLYTGKRFQTMFNTSFPNRLIEFPFEELSGSPLDALQWGVLNSGIYKEILCGPRIRKTTIMLTVFKMIFNQRIFEEWCLLGCYAVWLL
jgi:hypothetical protein